VALIEGGDIIPIVGMLTGVLSVGAISWAAVRVFQGPIGQALAKRLAGKNASHEPELVQEVLEIRHQLEQVQQRLTEAEERVDFNERLLAQRSGIPSEKAG
jgi:hypothetical protein